MAVRTRKGLSVWGMRLLFRLYMTYIKDCTFYSALYCHLNLPQSSTGLLEVETCSYVFSLCVLLSHTMFMCVCVHAYFIVSMGNFESISLSWVRPSHSPAYLYIVDMCGISTEPNCQDNVFSLSCSSHLNDYRYWVCHPHTNGEPAWPGGKALGW